VDLVFECRKVEFEWEGFGIESFWKNTSLSQLEIQKVSEVSLFQELPGSSIKQTGLEYVTYAPIDNLAGLQMVFLSFPFFPLKKSPPCYKQLVIRILLAHQSHCELVAITVSNSSIQVLSLVACRACT